MSEHADFGGSTIKRTVNCPAWWGFCKDIPKGPPSEYADRGTLLHTAMEAIYSADGDFDERSVIGSTYRGQTLTAALYEEKIVPAMAAMEALLDRYDVKEEDFLCEARVVIADDVWGTADFLAVGSDDLPNESDEEAPPSALLKVGLCSDYKFGYNLVDAEQNDQGLFYALAASMTPETERFFTEIDILTVAIVQPNEQGREDLSIWEVVPAILPQKKIEFLNPYGAARAS